MKDIVFRQMQAGEKALVAKMIMYLYQDDPDGKHMTEQKIQLTFEMLERHPDYGRILVFEQKGQIIGYAILINFWSNEYGGIVVTIDELFVISAFRNRGIGRAFISHLIATRYGSFVALKLEVLPYNTRALKLYQSLGFTQADRHHLVYSRKE
jgi:GNAT superfamily N-acetyltransferase